MKVLNDYHIAKVPGPVAPEVKKMIHLLHCFSDVDSIEEAKRDFSYWATNNAQWLIEGLEGIETTLINPPDEEGVLGEIVAWEANWVLDDPTDEGAKEWLREIAEMIRDALGDKAPPRSSGSGS